MILGCIFTCKTALKTTISDSINRKDSFSKLLDFTLKRTILIPILIKLKNLHKKISEQY